jgi:hypothetical protein
LTCRTFTIQTQHVSIPAESGESEQTNLELNPVMEVKKSMPAKTRTTVRKTKAQNEAAGASLLSAEEAAPFEQGMQTLFSLVGLMRTMSPDGSSGAANPKLILSNSGLELRVSPTEPAATPESADRLTDMERSLKLLSDRIAKMEAELGSQNAELDSLRAAVKQNEELMEALVDSISMMDDLTFGKGELALGSKPLAS